MSFHPWQLHLAVFLPLHLLLNGQLGQNVQALVAEGINLGQEVIPEKLQDIA